MAAGSSRRYKTPRASYRVQLNRGFTFDDARRLVPYLAELGISHLYCSPIFAATPGSTHGYDVTDHGQINPELGGLPGLHALSEALVGRDMGLIVDMVPNHVGLANSANPWWCDVLRYGEASRHATAFDINWSAQPHLPSGVLVYPILGQPFGRALEAGELKLELADNDLALRYYDHRLPLAPRSYAEVVGALPADVRPQLRDPAALVEFVDLVERLQTAMPEEAERLLERFRRVVGEEPALVEHLQARLDELNGRVSDAASFDQLESILARQYYRLAYWRVSGEEINYRRFFDINDLAGVRVEREDIFAATHRLLFSLVAQGIVTGVRIDHVDGLYDPNQYLTRLRAGLDEATRGLSEREVPIYVEKILELDEALPQEWPVAGTTGYDFMAFSAGLLVDRGSVVETTRTYERFISEPVRFRQMRYEAKRQIARTAFAGEINVLASQLYTIAQRDRRRRDNTLGALRRAIETTLATFPIYRTYVVEGEAAPGDRAIIEAALTEARRRDRTLSAEALDFLAEVLLLEGTALTPEEVERRLRFRNRFQQISSPVMAKGFEDTIFYRYNRLVSLNEVGNDPSHFGVAPEAGHAWFAARARDWPGAMSASSTHDTKRSEDARARLHVLAEMPGLWAEEVRRWAQLNERHRATVHGEAVPDRNTEYLLYGILMIAALVGGFFATAQMASGDPRLNDYSRWGLLVIPWLVIAVLAALLTLARSWQHAGRTILLAFAAAMVFFQVHAGWALAFQTGDVPNDMLVYVQTSPDVTRFMDELDEFSELQTGGKDIRIYYDDSTSWPFNWYLRNYTNKTYFNCSTDGCSLVGAPDDGTAIVLVGNDNLAAHQELESQLSDFVGQPYEMRWNYPEEVYRVFAIAPEIGPEWNNWSDQKPPYTLSKVVGSVFSSLTASLTPEGQANLFRIQAYHDLRQPLGTYGFTVFVHKDLLPQFNAIRYR